MIENVLLNSFLSLILVVFSSSSLGVLVLWKKMSYFGDALSHSILFGIVIGVLFDIDQKLSLILFCIIFSLLVINLSKNNYFSKDTMVMISSYFFISFALILNDFAINSLNFTSYIFGDPLSVEKKEILYLAIIACAVFAYIFIFYRKIIIVNINQDLAKIEGVKVEKINFMFLILLTITIAISIQIVGIFLMTALLVLPASIARIFSRSPMQMFILSLLIGLTISITAFNVANIFNLSISPTIIFLFSITFFVILMSSIILKICSKYFLDKLKK